jgi:mannose-6-phosphate isomerase
VNAKAKFIKLSPDPETVINKIVEKPWGREIWLALTKDYCFKRIEIKKGHKTSLQYHNLKEETNFLAEGTAIFHVRNTDGYIISNEVNAGFFVHLPPGTIHCFEAVTDIVLMEASNKYVDDIVRIRDEYGRS